jgi:hypothetical protein
MHLCIMLSAADKELLRRYHLDLLLDAERALVQQRLDTDASWRDVLEEIKATEVSETANIASEASANPQKRKRRSLTPGKKMMTVMIIGWIILAIAVVFVLIDVSRKADELYKDKEAVPGDTHFE